MAEKGFKGFEKAWMHLLFRRFFFHLSLFLPPLSVAISCGTWQHWQHYHGFSLFSWFNKNHGKRRRALEKVRAKAKQTSFLGRHFLEGFDFTPAWPIRISPSFQVVSGCRHETVGTIIRILATIRNHHKIH